MTQTADPPIANDANLAIEIGSKSFCMSEVCIRVSLVGFGFLWLFLVGNFGLIILPVRIEKLSDQWGIHGRQLVSESQFGNFFEEAVLCITDHGFGALR